MWNVDRYMDAQTGAQSVPPLWSNGRPPVCRPEAALQNNRTIKPALSDYLKQSISSIFQTGGCLMQNESHAENSLH